MMSFSLRGVVLIKFNDPTHVFRVEDVKLEDNLAYKELSIQILDRRVKELILIEIFF